MKRGFFDLRHVVSADVVCLQETRCDDAASIGCALGFEAVAADRRRDESGKLAHGGVAIFSRHPIRMQNMHTEEALRTRGQFVCCTITGVNVASVYVSQDAQPKQFPALNYLFSKLRADGAAAVVCGDMNTFRDARDSWSFANSLRIRGVGCDSGAMAWSNGLLLGDWVDAIEADYPKRPLYTWWQRPDLFDRGDGTRLDYILVSKTAHGRVIPQSAAVMTDERFGGHAQVMLTLKPDKAPGASDLG
ncbi:MAG: exoA [Candidatus Eremiobacteraeota bacterium]|nr:exoA [Candidatus Eremiobacteraeota bacterium]